MTVIVLIFAILFVFALGVCGAVWRAFRFQERVVKDIYDALHAAAGMTPEEWNRQKRELHASISLIQDIGKREELRIAVETYKP